MREQARLSQVALAERADLSVETISRLERGRYEPSLSSVVAVARALGVTLDALAGKPDGHDRAPEPTSGDSRVLAALDALDAKTRAAVVRALVLLARRPSPRTRR